VVSLPHPDKFIVGAWFQPPLLTGAIKL